ncbi:DUF6418 domain-containing protein [Burkholderia vietnamiensis]|uniref:DUF6418 domain-containing protein n=2 Tax=Burkholderia vietnamiensis TaxID=60552 RepID=A4JN75_BURVG|nr:MULTISPECIES: DUF6418 domain-containing protein [Burkholderia]ABO57728.1 hypothetical protein Bcep1808_4771 [Burkholderia vietnamiensis G4]AFJ88805.1 hypothetical protein MYA_4451 [Burkholderia sp. KJ006]AJY04501.1 putative membrane protein [Burkholderia vietnamiensis LMG 10929]AOJ98462.1 hypothetical protein WK23_07330 [Burkholderia vietnamiensis]AVR12193.1 hypothetical protein A8H33_01205 [Burkholderia vietnamiensis]
MNRTTGTMGGGRGVASASGVMLLTLFALALLFNAAMPALGLKESSALCTLLLATAALVGLVRSRPVFAVSMLYVLAIGMTAFLAGVGLENGGYLTETDVIGDATGAFSRLLSFYVIFVVCALVAFDRFLDERPVRVPIKARITLQPHSIAIGFVLAATIIAIGVLAGLTSGFSLFSGINRYALRNDSSNGTMFNLFLNNQSFMGFLLGTIATSPDKRIRAAAILTMAVDLALNVMHGEQFMAVLHIGLCSLAPFIAIHAMNGKPVVRYLGIGAGLALLLGAVSIIYSYRGQGLEVADMLSSRFLLQGQPWYVVDNDAHMFTAPRLGGTDAFWRFVSSLRSWTMPTFFDESEPSGLRDLMMSYTEPSVLRAYMFDDVTFTMGNMAVPVYWFGYAGGALFVAMTGLVYGALGALQILVAMRGGVVMLWLIAKVFSYATFAVQQGEYWMMFGSRTAFYALLALIWWYCVDARHAHAR